MSCQDTEITGSMEDTEWKCPVCRGEIENCSLREPALGSGIGDRGSGCSIWTRDTDLAGGSRASTARRQVRKREAFVELGGTFCPSKCWEMTIPLMPGRTRESGGVKFVVLQGKTLPTRMRCQLTKGCVAVLELCLRGVRTLGGKGRICHSEAAGTVCLCSVWVLYLHSQKRSLNLENADIY